MNQQSNRRTFLGALALGVPAFFTTRGAFAEQLSGTPPLTEGPFYPDKLPLDTDNDLLIVNDSITPAVGQIVHLSGRVLSPSGSPLRNATVEIWQTDSHGVYINTRAPGRDQLDRHFQGYGRFLTASTGEYYFRTIKPAPYSGRTRHIHIRVKQGGKDLLTTQIFVKGEPLNASDGVLSDLQSAHDRDLVTVDFTPVAGSAIGELAANFTLMLGRTPAEGPHGHPPGPPPDAIF